MTHPEIAQHLAAALVARGIPATVDGCNVMHGRMKIARVEAEWKGSGWSRSRTGHAAITIEGVRGLRSVPLAPSRTIRYVDESTIAKACDILTERAELRARVEVQEKAITERATADADMRDRLRAIAPGVEISVLRGVVTIAGLDEVLARAALESLAGR